MKRSAARSAALLHDGIDGRLCVFHSSHVELKARDEGHELCDANGTDVSSTHRNRRATPSRECDRFLFSIKTVRDVLDLRRLPGVAQRAILNAAKEKRTALIYDAPLGVVEWQRRLRDVARGQLRHPITGKSRRLAVLDGSALQTCAPRCPAKPPHGRAQDLGADVLRLQRRHEILYSGPQGQRDRRVERRGGRRGRRRRRLAETSEATWPTSARGRRRTARG